MKNSIIIAYILAFFCLSIYIAHFTQATDFPVFYSTAKTILENGLFTDKIYEIDHHNKYSIPEENQDLTFIYSKAAAILLSPLGFLPYYWAKTLLIIVNIVSYLAGVYVVLKICKPKPRMEFIFWGTSFFWLPFVQVLRFGQVDGILFLLIAASLNFCTKNKPWIAGLFLSLAMFFKLFPIAIAFALGIKEKRILISSILFFSISLLIPNSTLWFLAIPRIYSKAYSLIYLNLLSYGIWAYLLYVTIITGITAFLIILENENDYQRIFSFIIPGLFLVVPIVEYYHLTMLIISFISAFSFITTKSKPISILFIFLSLISISVSITVGVQPITFFGLFIIWSFHGHSMISLINSKSNYGKLL